MMGAQSYSCSGKPEPVEWLVKKARGKSRMSSCDLTRVGRGNRPINYSDFFDNQTKPNDISDADWLTTAEKAYDCIAVRPVPPERDTPGACAREDQAPETTEQMQRKRTGPKAPRDTASLA